MELKLTRCTIRDWRIDDASSLAKHANNRRVSINLRDRFAFPYGIEDAESFIERTLRDQPEKNFCIEINGTAVGGIGVHVGEDIFRHTAEIGYWLGEEFWGRGVMSEAVAAFTHYCFKEFSLHRIFAKAFSNNPASARVLEKAGFAFEGRLHKNIVKDGKILDSLLYARTI